MAKKPESQKEELMRLRKEVAVLRRENKEKNTKKNNIGGLLRTIAMILCLGISIGLFVIGSIFFWAGRTITNTDKYTETITTLVEQPEIQQAVATKITTAVFENYDVQSILSDSLPERAQFLAKPLSDQIKNYSQMVVEKALATEKFQEIWISVNKNAHDRLMNIIRSNASSDGVIDINELYTRLSEQLEGSGLAFLSNRKLPDSIGSIKVVDSDQLGKVHWLVVNLPALRAITIILAVGLLVAGIFLSRKRRRTVIASSLIIAVTLTLLAVSVRLAKLYSLDQVAVIYQPAFSATWKVIFNSFYVQLASTILLALIIAFVAWMTGKGRAPMAVRSSINDLLAGKVHDSVFKGKDPSWIKSLRRHRVVIMSLVAATALIYLALAPISFGRIILALIVTSLVLVFFNILIGVDKK